MLHKCTLALVSALLISGYSIPASAKSLTGAEIKTQIIGVNFKYRSRNNQIGTFIYAKNGTLRWNAATGASGTGEWRIEGDKMCTFFAQAGNWRGRPWRCGTMKSRGDKFRIGQFTLWR